MNNYLKISKFFLFIAPLAVIIVTPQTLFPFVVGKYVFFRAVVDFALLFFIFGLLTKQTNLNIKIDKWREPLVIAVTIFVSVFLLACFFGVDPKMSFWSNFERGEGGLQMLHLYALFILLVILFRDEKDWRKIFLVSILGGFGVILYGLLAGWGVQNFLGQRLGDPAFRFEGSVGNGAYAAMFFIFILFFSIYLLISKYKSNLKSFGAIGLMFSTVVFSVFLFLSATRGAFIGLIIGVISALFYIGFSIKPWRKLLFVVGIIVLLSVGSLIFFRDTSFIKSIPGSRVFDVSLQTENFQKRLVVWGMALQGFKERPLLGWGPENFSYIFDKHFDPKYYSTGTVFGEWYERAHNVFLDYLTQAGIFGLLSFLGIFLVFYWKFFKKKRLQAQNNQSVADKLEFAIIFSLPIVYLVQGLVFFDTLTTYINLFLFLAFVVYKNEKIIKYD